MPIPSFPPALMRLLPSHLRMAGLSLLLLLAVVGRIVSPVGGSLALAAGDGPVFLSAEMCGSMTDAPAMTVPGSLTSAHDCCWWMCGAPLPAIVLAVGLLLLLLPVLPVLQLVRWGTQARLSPRPFWRVVWASRAPPMAGPLCFIA